LHRPKKTCFPPWLWSTNTGHDTNTDTGTNLRKRMIECNHLCQCRVRHRTHLRSEVSVLHSSLEFKMYYRRIDKSTGTLVGVLCIWQRLFCSLGTW
jgi:hypothetical protein